MEQPTTNTEQPAAQTPVFELPADLKELQATIKELGGVNGVKNALQAIQVNASRLKNDMIGRIVANRQCAFTADELAGFSLEQLEKLERTLRPADYSGRSGLAANVFGAEDGEEWEDYVPAGTADKK